MEQKKFFVKDFIQYCSPCFACDRLMTFRFGHKDKGSEDVIHNNLWSNTSMAIVTDEYIEVELSIRYHTNLKIWVYHRTNKVFSSDQPRFRDYIAEKDLYLYSGCSSSCNSRIMSKTLDFQRYDGLVAPVSLRYEEFHINHKNKIYSITSDFVAGMSHGSLRVYTGARDLEWDMKLLPKYKLGTKQKLIDKLDTYAIFS